MKQSLILFSLLLLQSTSQLFGWELEEPVNHSKQFNSSQLVALIEVTGVKETGLSKKIRKGDVGYREIRLNFKILSVLKGENPHSIVCNIYREPTTKELMQGGMTYDQVRQRLLKDGNNSAVKLANVSKGEQLLVYLNVSKDGKYKPVSGDLESSRSLLRIKPSY